MVFFAFEKRIKLTKVYSLHSSKLMYTLYTTVIPKLKGRMRFLWR